MYTSKSAQACPSAVTRAANTQVTQFSTLPVTPACWGAAHAPNCPSADRRSRRSEAVDLGKNPGQLQLHGPGKVEVYARVMG